MKQRIITALCLIAVFSVAMILGPKAVFGLLVALILVASHEIYRLNRSSLKPIMIPIYASLTLLGGLMPAEYLSAFVALTIIVLFSCVVFFEWYSFVFASTAFIMIMMLVFAMSGVSMILLNFGIPLFIYIILATYTTDTFAYFGGMKFGKHKLIERISPKKTIEGAVIGYVCSLIVSLTYAYFFLETTIPFNLLIVTSFIIPFVSQIGDLAFSSIKRQFDVKDFGVIFPGHGGVLDRVDSVIFSIIAFNMIITLFL